MRTRSRLARRRVVLLAVAAAAALLSIGGLIGATFVKSPAQLAADTAAPPRTVTTAKAVNQVLTATVAMRGVVYPARQYDISAGSGGGPAYITKLGVSAGTSVTNGHFLAEIDGQPMFVLKGPVPAWRTMSPGESGPDIAELQAALDLLGYYDAGDKAGYFGAATQDAVSAFYAHLGYPAPTTGAATQQAVNQAQKAVNADEQRIATLKGKQLAAAQAQLSSDESALAAAQAVNGPEVPQDQVVFLPDVPATVVAVNGGVGQQPGAPFVELSAAGALSLTGELPPAYASQVRPGLTVTIYDEVTGDHATGKVSSVGTATTTAPAGTTITIGGGSPGSSSGAGAGSGSGAGSGAGSGSGSSGSTAFVPVNVTPASPLPAALNGENVLVTVETGQTEGPVLTVPVAALVTTAAGQSEVTVAGAGGKQTTVPVTPGMSANGYVQVTPRISGALVAGDNVVVSG